MHKLPRVLWKRKPFTQAMPNKKAVQEKYACRKSGRKTKERSSCQ